MSETSEVTITPHEEIILATVDCGQMRDEQANALQKEVTAAAEGTPELPVVVDMTKVEYIPSVTIGALVALWKRFDQAKRRFILVGLQPQIRKTLAVCRLDKVFEISESVDEALARIKQSE